MSSDMLRRHVRMRLDGPEFSSWINVFGISQISTLVASSVTVMFQERQRGWRQRCRHRSRQRQYGRRRHRCHVNLS